MGALYFFMASRLYHNIVTGDVQYLSFSVTASPKQVQHLALPMFILFYLKLYICNIQLQQFFSDMITFSLFVCLQVKGYAVLKTVFPVQGCTCDMATYTPH